MKKQKTLAQAITLGLLLAAPVGVWAAQESGSISTSTTIEDSIVLVADRSELLSNNTTTIYGIMATNGTIVNLSGNEIKLSSDTGNMNSTRTVWAGEDGKIALGNNESIININATGVNARGLIALGSKSELTVNAKELIINASGSGAAGIWVQSNTQDKSAPGNSASVKIAADNITVNSDDKGLLAFSNGQLEINGNLTVNAANAIDVRGNSTVNINAKGAHTTVLNGDIVFETPNTLEDAHNSGNLINSYVTVNLSGEDSSWTGRAYQMYGNGTSIELSVPPYYGNVTGFKMIISDGAQWNMTGDSFINNVTVEDGGVINVSENVEKFNADSVDLDNSTVNLLGDETKVNINTLSGDNGLINTNSLNNKMTVGNNTTTGLTVQGNSAITDKIVSGEASLQNLADVLSGVNEKNVKSVASYVAGEISAETDANGNIKASTVKESVNTDNQAISNMASIGLMTWRAENVDMNKRLGELRDSKGERGLWARMTRGESKYGAQNIKNQYSRYELGYDEKLSVDKHWTVGAAVSYTDGSSTFTNGRGENKHTGLSLYGSYLSDSGSFVDLIAKYARLDNEFDVLGGAGKGDYDTNGYSLSAEYGKRFTKDNGLWIEPQAQLTYGYVGAVNYLTNNDVSVRQDGMDTLVGRIGFALGKDIKQGNVYLRASYLYDFDGETDVRFSKSGVTRSFEQDLGGGWWEVGVGTNLNLSDATHLYFDVEKTYGGNVATPWQWNAGVRWSF